MTVKLGVGSCQQIAVGLPATYDAAGFNALTWITLEQAETLGTIGGETTIGTFIPVKTGVVEKMAGSTDYGTQDIPFAEDEADLGQPAFEAAFISKAKSSFRVLNAAGDAARAYTGIVSSFIVDLGGADDTQMGSTTVAINAAIITIAVP